MGNEGSMTAMVPLAAGIAGLGVAGVVVALTGPVKAGRIALAAVFMMLTLLATRPLLAAFAGPLIPLVTPWLLPVLLAAPATFHAFVLARAADRPVRPPITRLHLVLPGLGGLTALGYMGLTASQRTTMVVEGDLPPGAAPAMLALAAFALVLAWPVVSGLYAVAIVRLLARHRARLRDRFSNIDRMEMRWVEGFMGLVALVWMWAAGALLTDNLGAAPPRAGEIMLWATGALLLLLIGFSLSGRPVEIVNDESADPGAGSPQPPKYARSALSREHAQRLAERIGRAMQAEELHLDPNLSLTRLSRRVGATPNLVSQTLNDTLGRTFFDYVNDRRIDAAIGWLRETDRSVLDIAIAAGFNSRSTFYKAFKARTGLTPQDYRRGAGSEGPQKRRRAAPP